VPTRLLAAAAAAAAAADAVDDDDCDQHHYGQFANVKVELLSLSVIAHDDHFLQLCVHNYVTTPKNFMCRSTNYATLRRRQV